MSTFDEAALYAGVAEEAKRLAAVAAAHRTGRGEWYAVVELARASRDHPHVWEHITSAQEKCSSRPAAVEAGRRLERRRLYRTRIDALPRKLQPLAKESEGSVLAELATPLD